MFRDSGRILLLIRDASSKRGHSFFFFFRNFFSPIYPSRFVWWERGGWRVSVIPFFKRPPPPPDRYYPFVVKRLLTLHDSSRYLSSQKPCLDLPPPLSRPFSSFFFLWHQILPQKGIIFFFSPSLHRLGSSPIFSFCPPLSRDHSLLWELWIFCCCEVSALSSFLSHSLFFSSLHSFSKTKHKVNSPTSFFPLRS